MDSTFSTSDKISTISLRNIEQAKKLLELKRQNSLEKLFKDHGFSYEDGDYLLLPDELFKRFKKIHGENHKSYLVHL